MAVDNNREEPGGAAAGAAAVTKKSVAGAILHHGFELARGGWSKMPRLKDGSDWREALDAEEEEEDDEGKIGSEREHAAAAAAAAAAAKEEEAASRSAIVAAAAGGGGGGESRQKVTGGKTVWRNSESASAVTGTGTGTGASAREAGVGSDGVHHEGAADGVQATPRPATTATSARAQAQPRGGASMRMASVSKAMFKCMTHKDVRGGGLCSLWAQRGQCSQTETAEMMRRECKNSCCRMAALIRFKQKREAALAAATAAAAAAAVVSEAGEAEEGGQAGG